MAGRDARHEGMGRDEQRRTALHLPGAEGPGTVRAGGVEGGALHRHEQRDGEVEGRGGGAESEHARVHERAHLP